MHTKTKGRGVLCSYLTPPPRGPNLQEALARLMTQLGIDHPYHVLYQLLALQNGDRGMNGKPRGAEQGQGGMQQTVDTEKVDAATAIIAKIGKNPAR